MPIRTNVYVDGFNLYYGALKNTPFKWLNPVELSRRLLKPENEIHRIRYFTARVTPRPDDPNVTERQATYLRALSTLPEVSIHLGTFLTNRTSLPLADGSGNVVQVLKTEEKGSDVNLATFLLLDAFEEDFETALVISNDSDLVEPIREVRSRFSLEIGIACPVYPKDRFPSRELVAVTDFNVHITKKRKWVLRDSQFPDELQDGRGAFRKPPAWL